MAVSCPTHFRSEAVIPTLGDKRLLVLWGSKKQRKRGWDCSNFTKEETFLVF